MKKFIMFLIMGLFCFVQISAQKNNEERYLLNKVVNNLKMGKKYTILGCSVDKEYSGDENPFVKKLIIDFGSNNVVAFLVSYPFNPVNNSKLSCQYLLVSDRIKKTEATIYLEQTSKLLDALMSRASKKQFQTACGF